MVNQPLEIDYIYVKSPGVEEPKAGAGFWKQLAFRIEALAASFVEDYSDIAGAAMPPRSPKPSTSGSRLAAIRARSSRI